MSEFKMTIWFRRQIGGPIEWRGLLYTFTELHSTFTNIMHNQLLYTINNTIYRKKYNFSTFDVLFLCWLWLIRCKIQNNGFNVYIDVWFPWTWRSYQFDLNESIYGAWVLFDVHVWFCDCTNQIIPENMNVSCTIHDFCHVNWHFFQWVQCSILYKYFFLESA